MDFAWAYQESTASKNFPEDRIILLKQAEGGKVKSQKWSDKYSVFYSDNLFQSKIKILLEKGNRFALSDHFLFIAKLVSEEQ